MRSSLVVKAAVLAAAVVAAAPASAAVRPRICVFGVKGDGGAALMGQLSRALCDEFECVAAESVRAAGKLDFGAVRAQGVAAVLFGTATHGGRSSRLALALLATSFTPQRTWSLPLDGRGRVEAAALASLAGELRGEVARTGPAPAAARPEPSAAEAGAAEREAQVAQPAPAAALAVAQRAPASSPAPASAPSSLSSSAPSAATSPSPVAPRAAASVASAAAPPVREPGAPWAAIDLGMAYASRELRFTGATASTATLLGVRADSVMSPAARVEVSPLVGARGRWYQGAALFAGYSRSVMQYTRSPSGANKETTFSHLEAGAGVRFRPAATWRATLLGDLSYQAVAVKLSPRNAIPGLPDVDLSGLRAGLLLEAPLTGRYGLLVGGGLTYWLRARDLVGSTYFSSGTALGADASGGVSIALRAPFSLRVLVDWAQTRYWFSSTSALHASGATDSSLGARVLARATF